MHVWGDGFQASQLFRYKVVTKKMSENTYGTSNSHFHIFIASANTIQTVRVVEHLRPIKVPVILIKIVTLPALKKGYWFTSSIATWSLSLKCRTPV